MNKYSLNFKGYWLEPRISGVPQTSGIYLVYRCTCDDEGVSLKELLYIGQAKNLYERITTHEKKEVFEKECRLNEFLCYSVAEVSQKDLDIVENALIFAQKPRLNVEYKDRFRYEVPVSFLLEGRCKLMIYQNFTIK